MKHFNKIASVCFATFFGMVTLAGCEDAVMYEVGAPDWLSDKINEIADSQKGDEEIELEGMNDDVYAIGKADYSSGWWADFSKYYVIPDGQKWNAVFNLNINPNATNTYKNFALILCNDADRDSTDPAYAEYGAIRFDNQPSGNSEWGDHIDRSFISSTLTFDTDTDKGIEKLGGQVILVVDRTDPAAFSVTMTNGTVTKTYKQPTPLVNLNTDPSNTNIRCFLCVEGSHIGFLQSNIEPIGGYTSAEDKNPVSLVLANVPEYVDLGTDLAEAMAEVTGTVTFEEGVTKDVTAADLVFTLVSGTTAEKGPKTLLAIYNKTFKGENCDAPIAATATFEVVDRVIELKVSKQPAHTAYYIYTPAEITAPERTLAFDPTGMEVMATYQDGRTEVIENSRLTFTAVPATAGKHTVTMQIGEATETVEVTVTKSTVSAVKNSSNMVGAEDNSTAFWGAFSDDFNVPSGETKSITFTNYSSMANNWNNYVVILRKADMAEYAVAPADSLGGGAGYGGNATLRLSGGQPDWAVWLAGMSGAEVTVYVTNCGNGTADVQAVMKGTDGTTSIQYYLGIATVDPDDLNFALTVDGCHLVFGE